MSVFFGVDYYPEHWARDRWETDARLMQEMGLNIVRMGEFSWAKFEPREGEFHFGWLDEAIALLAGHGIKTLIGTPTAAPPAWIIEKDPDILPMDSQGQQKGFGGRHHDCQSNVKYREHIRRLVTAMAEHYKDNKNVIGWQIDNELGNSHEDLCMCDSCRHAFQQWLKGKYGNIENLNEEWGTVFWSQSYDKFSQVPAPRVTPTMHNPSLLLDWKRFCSDLVVDFQKLQVDIIKSICPHQPVTHNLMGLYDKTDYFDLASDLDFASNDQYPTGYYFTPPGQPPYEISACLDFIRSVKKKNFWMMELESGPTGGAFIGRMPRPGQLRLWTLHCIAHGSDTIVYFRWRTCLFGTEQFWHGILPHNGVPGRRYQELKDTMAEMVPVLKDIQGIVPKAEAAILFSYDQNNAIKIQPHHPELDYIEQVKKYYDSFYERNIPLDFIGEKEDFQDYRLVIAPLQFLMDAALEDKLMEYVKKGGRLVLTMRTGVKNRNNVCMSDMPLPGRLGEMLGIKIEDYDCPLGLTVQMEWAGTGIKGAGLKGTADKWCDIVTLVDAEPLAFYRSEYYKNTPAVTVNSYGAGKAYYVATEPDKHILGQLAELLREEAGLEAMGESPKDVELTLRKGRRQDYLFAINHTDCRQEIRIDKMWKRMDGCTENAFVLEEYGVNIYIRQSGAGQ